ncbi:uncharacterized protein LOC108911222 [Anoplophora glabripennis]|uniref:uncharacterized protein LOC108911222 n=1 Tax=Anoplophora glabripennis TaxID=217634 RepID=UPI000874D979|nr:uncharacterized protein LOC108911222 [Anoplophora glabripennis]
MYTLRSFLFLVCFLFSKSICQDYTVTPITTSSGLYYEKIGEVLLSNSNWQFVTSVDYTGYLLFYKYLLQQAKEIETFCETLQSPICRERYNRIQSNLDKIEETDESMANFLGITTETRRVKRFWSEIGSFLLNLGGGIVKSIFAGGSSNVDLSAYNRAINNLQNGQQELENQLLLQRTVFTIDSEKKNKEIAQLNKNQVDIKTKIISLEQSFQIDKDQKEKEIKELKKTLDEINVKIKKQEENQKRLDGKVSEIENNLLGIHNSIKEIKSDVANNTKRIDKLQVISQLNIISTDFILLMNQFQSEQQILFEVIKTANAGQLDPYILTPSKLTDMLRDIQEHLPEGTKFPYYPNIKNAQKLYNIIKPSVYLFDYKVIFILNIPLAYSKTFNLHKLTSLPAVAQDNKFVFILPQEPFLIIDNNYQDYMLMSKDNFKSFCSDLETTKYICQQVGEVFHSQYSEECEINLFKSPRQIPQTCNKRIMALDKPMFIQLQQERSWIYAVPTVENIIMSCGNNRTTVNLIGTGFIHVNEQCLVFIQNGKSLSYFTTFTKPVESHFSPSVNLTDFIDISQVDGIDTQGVKTIQNIYPFDFKKLEDVSYKIIESKANLIPLYCTLFVLLLIVSVLIYLVYKKKITLDKLSSIWSIRRQRTPTQSGGSADPENIKMKIKVKNADDLQNVSIYGKTSDTDPESEYVTVKFKVKKDENEPSVSHKKIIQNKLDYPPKNLPPKVNKKDQNEASLSHKKIVQNMLDYPPNNLPPKVNKEDQYLNDLRKLKPKQVNDKY